MAEEQHETTGRRIVNFANGDRVHRTINWTTLIGTVVVAVLGYLADRAKGHEDDNIKASVAREVAALREWKAGATDDLKEQAAQIGNLREAVAGLRVAVDMLTRGRDDAHQAAQDVDTILQRTVVQHPVRAEAPAPPSASVEQVQRELFEPPMKK